MVSFPNNVIFSLYDAQWSTVHCAFVHVEGLMSYYFQPKFQALQQPRHRNSVLPGAWHALSMCLSTVGFQIMFLSVCFM